VTVAREDELAATAPAERERVAGEVAGAGEPARTPEPTPGAGERTLRECRAERLPLHQRTAARPEGDLRVDRHPDPGDVLRPAGAAPRRGATEHVDVDGVPLVVDLRNPCDGRRRRGLGQLGAVQLVDRRGAHVAHDLEPAAAARRLGERDPAGSRPRQGGVAALVGAERERVRIEPRRSGDLLRHGPVRRGGGGKGDTARERGGDGVPQGVHDGYNARRPPE
jgi:hypothetical protein